MTVSAVVLTTGSRPAELRVAVDSIVAQDQVVETVIVANGCQPDVLPGADVVVVSDENVGVPAGRNLGWRAASGDVVVFLDDDARLCGTSIVSDLVEAFESDPSLAAISCRIVDPDGRSQRHHVPRLRVGDPARSGAVTSFLGGACALRRSALEEVGGFPDEFFYAHEEADVAWALLDLGHRLEYRGDLTVEHPRVEVGRHPDALFHTARNRVWLARRRLPRLVVLPHVVLRFLLSLRLVRSRADAGALLRGTWRGIVTRPSPGRRIRWSTVWRMTRLGHPPIL
jgi:GT2 family glycosyltransferase